HVMGYASSSRLLASLTVRRRVERALDLGCGSGIEAILAAGHADQVIATDINPRALAFTAFNAALNGMNNVECREGSFFEPVAGETFDLIVSNPPFVISPEKTIVFRDGGLRADDVGRLVLRESAGHLRDGALAFVMMNWGIGPGGDWRERPSAWAADLPCDVWVLQREREMPLLYAASWNDRLLDRPTEYASALDRWSAYLAGLGFASVGFGVAIVRKPEGPPRWVRFDEIAIDGEEPAGEQIARLIAAQDFLAGLADDRELLGVRLALAPEHRLDEALRQRDGSFVVEGATLRSTTGLGFALPLDGRSLALLARLDDRPVGVAMGRDPAAIDLVKRLLGLGLARVV
ncbi:MAG TPA: methyltransferase, partial [Candidatus Limnocylindria bacterium]|nr:methyltransferase [Candidatus Limnocylindria bacterium]